MKMSLRLMVACFVCIALKTHAQERAYSPSILSALKKTKNRKELEKALQYFYKNGDKQKISAIEFLISNIAVHSSNDFYWEDYKGNRVPINEINYAKYIDYLNAVDSIKKVVIGLHPESVVYNDADTITASYLIDEVNTSFDKWKQSPLSLSFPDYCEYLLPYRTSVEPLQNWRRRYESKFSSVGAVATEKGINTKSLTDIKNIITSYIAPLPGKNLKNDPQYILGPINILLRTHDEGDCQNMAAYRTYILRSQGIPATVDIVPFWGTSTGSHYSTVTMESGKERIAAETGMLTSKDLIREPAKVLRTTFSSQKNTIASLTDEKNIPPGVLRNANYLDVTKEYWSVQDVQIPLFFRKVSAPSYVFACVLNGLEWRPVWWSRTANNRAVFTNMSKGVVYLPMYYVANKLQPAGNPIAVGSNSSNLLSPDTLHRRIVQIKQQDSYLIFRPGKKYTMFYWNNRWTPINTQIPNAQTKELVFENVPKNALLLLVPEYSKGLERPFIITNEGERVWF
ncbi:hypothetical protein [Pinibacter soli]|uniref:Transglutaminase domain-containing protein n=1 Tax=Pinibacter soli TaxID=3044211 RepID=A0ABT6RIX3_9BACT|nr:hypothetical protein [Pinibacter soli]MDI3322526.1 hypothetical protein [Pinibacter soli]